MRITKKLGEKLVSDILENNLKTWQKSYVFGSSRRWIKTVHFCIEFSNECATVTNDGVHGLVDNEKTFRYRLKNTPTFDMFCTYIKSKYPEDIVNTNLTI